MTDPVLCLNLLLDDSGSMSTVAPATISGFNEYINAQRSVPGTVLFTFCTFESHDKFRIVQKMVRLDQVHDLHEDTYKPNGAATALYDGIADFLDVVDQVHAVAQLQHPDAEVDVVNVILTDGGENNSQRNKREDIFKRISAYQADKGYTFAFLGANQDAYAVGGSIGVAAGSTRTYAGTKAGTAGAFAAASNSTLRYRNLRSKGVSGQSISSSYFADEPETITGEDAK